MNKNSQRDWCTTVVKVGSTGYVFSGQLTQTYGCKPSCCGQFKAKEKKQFFLVVLAVVVLVGRAAVGRGG